MRCSRCSKLGCSIRGLRILSSKLRGFLSVDVVSKLSYEKTVRVTYGTRLQQSRLNPVPSGTRLPQTVGPTNAVVLSHQLNQLLRQTTLSSLRCNPKRVCTLVDSKKFFNVTCNCDRPKNCPEHTLRQHEAVTSQPTLLHSIGRSYFQQRHVGLASIRFRLSSRSMLCKERYAQNRAHPVNNHMLDIHVCNSNRQAVISHAPLDLFSC